MKLLVALFCSLAILSVGAGCTKKAPASPSALASARITGKITYLEKMALPADALIEVQLEDTSRQDAAGEVIGEQTILNPGQVPVSFSIDYDPARIVSGHSYGIRAKILSNGQLLYTNSTAVPVITNGKPAKNVEVIVQPAK